MKYIVALLCATAFFFTVMISPAGGQSLVVQNKNPSNIPIIIREPARYKTVVVLPIFTQAAYSPHGFYWFYSKKCDAMCLTVPIPRNFTASYVTGGGLDDILLDQGFSTVTDLQVDKNPSLLEKFDKVILLHNEYVTRTEFDAIVRHPHVIYMYPNALYAEVKVNYDKNTITLVRGHGYPEKSIRNGFGWAYDNSKYEYNTSCENWQFDKIKNGYQLDCYPQLAILDNPLMIDKMIYFYSKVVLNIIS